MFEQLVIDAAKSPLEDYVVVFPDNQPPPQEHFFSAIADDHAKALMRKLYPSSPWTLFRISKSQQRERIYAYPERVGPEAGQLPEGVHTGR